MSTGSDHRVTEGPGGTEEERAAAAKLEAKRRAGRQWVAAKRQRIREEETAARLASLAAPPPETNVFTAEGVRVSGTLDFTPSESVHSMGATVVRDVVLGKHFPGVKVFNALSKPMDGLFGKGLFPVTRDSYARSAEASKRRSVQLLPVEKGPTTEEAPWMEDMVSRVQRVLTKVGILGEQHELGAMTLLLSMPGACQQDYHCDFPWNHRVFSRKSLEKDGTVPYPVSVLIAFHDKGASLPLMRGKTIVFDKFSAVVFRGDLEHAGAEWTRFQRDWNFRVHMYFVTAGKSASSWKTCKVPRGGRGNNIQVCPTRDEEYESRAHLIDETGILKRWREIGRCVSGARVVL